MSTESEIMFTGLLKSFVANGMINLGEQTNPLTGKKEVNLNQAAYSIKMLEMIRDKTHGNLSKSEQDLLRKYLTHLKRLFVKISDN
ncbi:MAG: DUF1844 domain-containing protein [Candidatus Marinimicrobia bacterium]|nr:DUF1844 domain-containing protein [Candidatus Neomarinimicrobiota bacterium]